MLFLRRFRDDFCSARKAKNEQKCGSVCSKSLFSVLNIRSISDAFWARFWEGLGSILGGFSVPRPNKWRSRAVWKRWPKSVQQKHGARHPGKSGQIWGNPGKSRQTAVLAPKKFLPGKDSEASPGRIPSRERFRGCTRMSRSSWQLRRGICMTVRGERIIVHKYGQQKSCVKMALSTKKQWRSEEEVPGKDTKKGQHYPHETPTTASAVADILRNIRKYS